MISEEVLKHEVEMVPIKVNDFTDERSVTRRYMFHSLIFTWKPTYRFKTDRLQMLGFLMCSHRSAKQARDSMWGLMNPYIQERLSRDHIKEFMEILVSIATDIPLEYF